jgi:hypothetical protein
MSTAHDLEYAEEASVEEDYFQKKNRNGEGAAAGRDVVEPAYATRAVPRAIVVEYLFSWATAALAAVYVGALLWRYFSTNYFSPTADASELAGTLRGNPQAGVALCLVFAAAFVWLWKGLTGKVLALITYLFIAWQFYYWFILTRQVKANTGRDVVSDGGWISNTLYGAGWLEAGTLLVVLAFIVLSLYLLRHGAVTAVTRSQVAPGRLIGGVNGYGTRR